VIILASMAKGPSRIRGIPPSADLARTVASVRDLGVRVEKTGSDWIVSPVDRGGLAEPEKVIQCGDSGTTMRLLSGLLAAGRGLSVLTGSRSLLKRPMDRLVDPLSRMGASIFGRDNNRFAPLVVIGRELDSLDYRLPVPSAQVKSSILLAGIRGRVEIVVREDQPSRDHLEILLEEQGAGITREDGTIRLVPRGVIEAIDMKLPGDPSSAAFFIALTLLVPNSSLRVKNVLLNPTRIGYIGVLTRMGADIRIERKGKSNGEEVGDILVRSSDLVPTRIHRDEIPSIIDEIPILAVIAARSGGETDFPHLEELRVKESDRIRSIVENLRAIGIETEERPDGFKVQGTRENLNGMVRSFQDHRIAMAFSILGASPYVNLTVRGERCVTKSFPGFFDEFESIARGREGPTQ
jgi:3-phosphoshikimate 1-carboxyvinyltransferase